MQNRCQNLILDFTHVYEDETVRDREQFQWIDCSDIEESHLYCSPSAYEEIRKRIEPFGISGIHFIDSGDYHYICIDKDVLDEKYAVTNWDQGKMSMRMLEQILKTLVTEYDVIGVDICGMYPEENSLPEYLRAERVNIRSDEELYRFLQISLLKKKELLSL